MPTMTRPWLALLVVALASAGGWIARALIRSADDVVERATPTATSETRQPAHVGRDICASCHAEQAAAFTGSHHDRAMEEATDQTVLGDFDDARFTYAGLTTTFFRRDGGFWVRTDGPTGALEEYEVAYTFGVEPLQQLLLRYDRGRYQALGIAWDTRPESAGGQRWFHLYPDEQVDSDDVLHWTKPSQSWNIMCAACHSTGLDKGYDLGTDRFETTWQEIDVSCEACHGPGARHVAWAKALGDEEAPEAASLEDLGLVGIGGARPTRWVIDPKTGLAKPDGELAPTVEVETCAPCHSRRSQLSAAPAAGAPLADGYRLSLLDAGLYEADGQVRDEVYVHGSFLQSRMHTVGVRCSDCHDPHSLETRALGNALCARCHQAARFDTPSHHLHEAGTPGAQCVSCHMPEKTYMGVDARRDHSFRVPRPDLTEALGVPNACNGCHEDRSPRWAAARISERFGPERRRGADFALALAAGRDGLTGADLALSALVRQTGEAPIVRATALAQLARRPLSPALVAAIAAGAKDEDPLLRAAAATAAESIPAGARATVLAPLLKDPRLAVRVEAGRVIATVPRGSIREELRASADRAIGAYRAAQHANAERPEAHVNLGLLEQHLGRLREAEASYRTAIRLGPHFLPGYVNLADLYRATNRDDEGEAVLRAALATLPARDPSSASVHHALGLLWIRKRGEEGARLVHFIGKDNITFHCIMFPAMLAWQALDREGLIGPGPGEQYVLPENVPANEFFHLEGKKFNEVGALVHRRWTTFVDKYGADRTRFYLISAMPETADAELLVAGVQGAHRCTWPTTSATSAVRVLKFVASHFDNQSSRRATGFEEEARRRSRTPRSTRRTQAVADAHRERTSSRSALQEFVGLAQDGNQYLDKHRAVEAAQDRPRGVRQRAPSRAAVPAAALRAGGAFVPGLAARLRAMLRLPPREPERCCPRRRCRPGTRSARRRYWSRNLRRGDRGRDRRADAVAVWQGRGRECGSLAAMRKDLTQILKAVQAGDPRAADRLAVAVYEELRRLAARKLAHEPPGLTLQATALVHEAYLRLVGDEQADWQNRAHFFAAAADGDAPHPGRAWRAARRNASKARRRARRQELDEAAPTVPAPLGRPARPGRGARVSSPPADPVKAELVKLRFFAGLEVVDAARVLQISKADGGPLLGLRARLALRFDFA